MNPSQGNLVDIHQLLGPTLMKYWTEKLENEAADFESVGNTHVSAHYRQIAKRLKEYQGTPLINGAEVQAHITGVGASIAAKFNEWTAELQTVADVRTIMPNNQNISNNTNDTANNINNNTFTTPVSSSKKRTLSDSPSNGIINNHGSLPASGMVIQSIMLICQVSDWLRDLGLSEYLAVFLSNGIDSISEVLKLNQNLLRGFLMITNADHIRTLLTAINTLKLTKLQAFPELSKLNEFSIRQFGLNNEKIYPRAVEYVEKGKVLSILKKPGNRYEARVTGNETDPLHPEYNVVIRFAAGKGDPILNTENCLCSCPFFRRQKLKPPCKHLIAVLLQLYHRSETIKIVVPSPIRANSQSISPNNSNNNATSLTSSADGNNNSPPPQKRSRKSPNSGSSRKKGKATAADTPQTPEAMWFAAMERHIARMNPESSQTASQSTQSSQASQGTATPGRRPKEYLPKPRSGPHALLLALHRAEQIPGYVGYLSSADLKARAQPLCDSSFDLAVPSPDYRQNFTAWNGMKTLEGHNLVKTIVTPDHYTLTEAGRELARKLEAIEEESASVGNFSPGAKTPLRTSGASPTNNLLSASSNNNSNNSTNNRTPSPGLARSMSAPVTPVRNLVPPQPTATQISPSQPLVTVPASQTQSQVANLSSPQSSPVKPLSLSQTVSPSWSQNSSTQDILSPHQPMEEDELERALRESRELSQRHYYFVDHEGMKVQSKEKAEVDIQDSVLKYRVKYKDTGQYGWVSDDSAQDFDVEEEDMDALEESVLSQPQGTQNSIIQPELLLLSRIMEAMGSQQGSQVPAQPPITTTPPPAVPRRETLLASGTIPAIKTPPSPLHSPKSTPAVSRVLFPSAIDLTESDDEAENQPLNFRLPNTPTTPTPKTTSPAMKSPTSPTPAAALPRVTSPTMSKSPQSKSPILAMPSLVPPGPTSPVIITPPTLVSTSPIVQQNNNHVLPSPNIHNNNDEHASLLPGLTAHVEGYLLPTELLRKPIHETEIVLVLDHREQWPDIDMDVQLKAKGIKVERRSLKLSDLVFVIRGVNQDTPEYMMNLVIERKQASDFFASIRDKRLEEQKHRLRTLKSYGINAMVLLEGRLGVEANKENVCILVPQEHLDNIIFMDGFPVKKTKSASQTLEFLIQAHVYLQEALKGARIHISGITYDEYNRLNAKSFGLTRQSLFERQLMQFHTMTPLSAKTITKNFPTIKHLVEAFTNRNQPDMLSELVVSTMNNFHPVSKELSTRLFDYYCQ